MKNNKIIPDVDMDNSKIARTVSADPGLLSNEELLEMLGDRRLSLKLILAGEKSKERSSASLTGKRIVENARKRYDDLMMAATIFVLFGDDIRILSFQPSADSTFAFFTSLSFFLFLLEIILHSWAKSDFSGGLFRIKGYACSFFFWLDLLAVLSMVPDVAWLASSLGMQSGLLDSFGTKAGKAGKIGAKSSRVIRMARLVRLVKLYKVTSQRSREKQQLDDLKKLVELGHYSHVELQEYLQRNGTNKQSKVGAELSDIITRRVIIAVLLMLCIVPLLTYSSPIDDERDVTFFMHSTNMNAASDCDYLERSIVEFRSFMEQIVWDGHLEQPLLVALDVNPKRCQHVVSYIDFVNEEIMSLIRDEALRVVTSEPTTINGVTYSVSATFNETPYMMREATSSIYLMFFVLVMLVVLSTQFTGDAQRLVLAPIENMMTIVNMVADDPLEVFDFKNTAGSDDYETQVIQMAIEKITALLRIGFGVAGAEIISSNMTVEGGGSACLNPMIPGKRVYALFGFCDIMSFDLCTEKLEDEIMTFVNSVARIVHDEVTRWGGTCNKNLGNAFLMVWRIGDEKSLSDYRRVGRRHSGSSWTEVKQSQSPVLAPKPRSASYKSQGDIVDLRRIPGLDVLSDKALVGFLKVIVEINRDVQLLSYRKDRRLVTGGEKGFLLRMGFGLHAGWAIEGAVGSLQKVDATYLSPHVNMAARMEAATRQFGVAILITRQFFKLMSETAQIHCRKVDIVTVKGSNVPMPIYTYDTFQKQIFPQLRTPKYSNLCINEVLAQQAENYDVSVWMTDPDLIQLRCLATPEFLKAFEKGLKCYLEGNWEEARSILGKADEMMSSNDTGGDGPSRAILKYMKANDWSCPPTWSGHRPLTSK
eukprot:CCRYP_020319-RA/>CCRYP_020319-RA protein AED:0.07 eAED:0.07 QI:0/0.85/0.87/1/0.57/0.37/8/2080/875